eukprot:scaffold152536_cov30-Tisochrysis_lutea.AAC.7
MARAARCMAGKSSESRTVSSPRSDCLPEASAASAEAASNREGEKAAEAIDAPSPTARCGADGTCWE